MPFIVYLAMKPFFKGDMSRLSYVDIEIDCNSLEDLVAYQAKLKVMIEEIKEQGNTGYE